MFADFDTDDSDVVALRRISFDGFGCCRVEGLTSKMSCDDSRVLLDAVSLDQLEAANVEDVLRRYFRDNKNVIWVDALSRHDLL